MAGKLNCKARLESARMKLSIAREKVAKIGFCDLGTVLTLAGITPADTMDRRVDQVLLAITNGVRKNG